MNSPAIDVRDQLILDGFTDDIYIGSEPDGPNVPHNVVTLYDISGGMPNPKYIIDNPSIQIRVRNSDYIAGYQLIWAYLDNLIGRPSITINGSRYVGFIAKTDPIFLERDGKQRAIFVVTIDMWREVSSSTHRTSLPTV